MASVTKYRTSGELLMFNAPVIGKYTRQYLESSSSSSYSSSSYSSSSSISKSKTSSWSSEFEQLLDKIKIIGSLLTANNSAAADERFLQLDRDIKSMMTNDRLQNLRTLQQYTRQDNDFSIEKIIATSILNKYDMESLLYEAKPICYRKWCIRTRYSHHLKKMTKELFIGFMVAFAADLTSMAPFEKKQKWNKYTPWTTLFMVIVTLVTPLLLAMKRDR